MKKKLFTITILATSLAVISCSDDYKEVGFAEIPATAKTFLNDHFATGEIFDESQIRYIERDKDGTYEVHFYNAIEIDFYANGDWEKIDMNAQDLPVSVAALVPSKAIDYITNRYPNDRIEEIEKKGNNVIELELMPSDIEILFDLEGNVMQDPGTGGSHVPEAIDPSLLPAAIQSFLSKHFEGVLITEVEKDYKEYEIELVGGYDLDFDLEGNFKSIDAEAPNSVPESLFADTDISANGKAMLDYVKANHNGTRIEEYSKLSSYFTGAYKDGYKIELDGNPDLDLFFTKDGAHIVTNTDH